MKSLPRVVVRWFVPLLLLPAAAVQASEDEELALAYGDQSTISLATGMRQPLRRAPAVATVITAEDIAAMGATDLDQVLETVAGLHINVAPSARNTLYVIRGVFSLQTPQVLVLQNGIPLTVLLTGGRGNLSGLPAVENIARVEILRGPGSALFGADAFSGVINIITRGAGELPGTQVAARAGSFGSADAWLRQGGSAGGVAWAAFAKLARTDGLRRTIESDAQTRNDRLFGTQAGLAPGPVTATADALDAGLELAWQQWRWRALYKLRDNVGTYGGLGSALDPIGRGRGARLVTDLGWSAPASAGSDWSFDANVSWVHFAQRFPVPARIFPPGTRFPTGVFVHGMFGAPEVSERSLRVQAHAAYAGWNGHALRLGVGYENLHMYMARDTNNFRYTASGIPIPNDPVRLTDLPFIYPQRREVLYAFVQDEWHLHPDWTLTAGVRHDQYSDAGGTTNPRLALVWDATVDWTVKVLYGQAFRAPTFSELYATNNPIAHGNPALRPETTRTVEAVSSWQATPDLQLTLSIYSYRMRDIARTVPNPSPAPGTTYMNTGRQHGKGFEAEAVWDATRQLRLSGHLSVTRAVDPATGADVGNVPRRDVFLRADWRIGRWRLDAMLNHIADRRRARGDARPPVPDYTTLDLTLSTDRSARGWFAGAALRNAFDEDVREPNLAPGLIANDLPQAGRTLTLQIGYAF
ncbi:TonB-dependent receptor [Aquincola sp. S2]|uniref:TonB-dependent receptor n=1 Tax=Pseudaquabacterium terrae TaxID=2732868 RepID=A0ABX2EMP7_9BURK|nr:TonB-dependent receptor [Aquabacterium terrae]NRF69901.1 TonB-dependent receptor [Aquabacterium terrae]